MMNGLSDREGTVMTMENENNLWEWAKHAWLVHITGYGWYNR